MLVMFRRTDRHLLPLPFCRMPAATVAAVGFGNHCRFQLLLISSFDQIGQNLPGRPPALNAAV
jgi:hypothetical protein